MRFEDLSPADQALLNTDFGALEKVAEEQVKVATEMYSHGEDMALASADQMDKLAEEEEKKDDDDEGDEEEKKAAADYGNIIAEGFIDKLAALGQERYNDPMHYFVPFIEEKVAAAGAMAALSKFKDKAVGVARRYGAGAKENVRKAVTGEKHRDVTRRATEMAQKHPEKRPAMEKLIQKSQLSKGQRAAEAGKAVAKASPILGAGGLGAYLATRKKKDEAAS